MTAAAPTVTRPVGRCPVTRLVIRIRDLSSEPPRSSVRFQFRDRRPRYLPVRSRGGVGRRYASTDRDGNGTLVPIWRRRRSGAAAHRNGTLVPGASAHRPTASRGDCRYAVFMLGLGRTGVFVLIVGSLLNACSGGPPPSFDPTGDCTTDGRAPGAYPELEALVPTRYQGVPPGTLDSGRNCT